MAKYHHFGKNLQVFGSCLMVYLVFGIIFITLGIFNAVEQIFIAIYGKILNK